MKIVYIYTALTLMGGVDRVLINKANYLADTLRYDIYIITDSQCGKPIVFPLSPNVHHIDLEINFNEQYKYGIIILAINNILPFTTYSLNFMT
ncbi:MAG: hypothetical protein K2G91_06050, partial [Prevotella sp.]|nr:hypothetical protein [Prevotella sp.]